MASSKAPGSNFASTLFEEPTEDFAVIGEDRLPVADLVTLNPKSVTVPTVEACVRGAQFTSREYTNRLKDHGVAISMDGKGRAIDNVMIER